MRSERSQFCETFSLRDLLLKETSFLTEKIFKLNLDFAPNSVFQYVTIKVKALNMTGKVMIQIIDSSDKMMYSEVSAEKSFLALINAAVSHELRNPLSSLIGQIEQIQDYFDAFNQLLGQIKDEKILVSLKNFQTGIEQSCSKMFSASKFIDFFVHDILDYTLLNKDQKNFIKNPKVVNIMDAIDEIVNSHTPRLVVNNRG